MGNLRNYTVRDGGDTASPKDMMPSQPIGKFDQISGEFVFTERWHCLLGTGGVLEVDAGFASDGASVPIQTPVSPRFESTSFPAAAAHDALYMAELLNRKQCDLEFHRLLKLCGMSAWRSWLYYQAVRMFGWIVWQRHTKESITEARKLCRIISGSYQYH